MEPPESPGRFNIQVVADATQGRTRFEFSPNLTVDVTQSSGDQWGSSDESVRHQGVPIVNFTASCSRYQGVPIIGLPAALIAARDLLARTRTRLQQAESELDAYRNGGDVVSAHMAEAAQDKIAAAGDEIAFTLRRIQRPAATMPENRGGPGGLRRALLGIQQVAARVATELPTLGAALDGIEEGVLRGTL